MSNNTIVLKITEFGASSNFGKTKVSAAPEEEIFYSVSILPEHYQTREDGSKVFTIEGIRHILRGLSVVLYLGKDGF
jgi:hypothetical protein